MNILGLSCYYHDAAACLIRDGVIVAAAQEERFNRLKYSPEFPAGAINYCLQAGDIIIDDVDHIAFYEMPFLKLQRVVLNHILNFPRSFKLFLQTMPSWLSDRLVLPITLKKNLGYEGPVHFLSHHLAHAASSFYCSPFEEAAILTADGIGEWASTTLAHGRAGEIHMLNELRYPNSLGLLYTAITTYLGFRALSGEGKVMALAEFGEPAYLDRLRSIVNLKEDGSLNIDRRYFTFFAGRRMYTRRFVKEMGPEYAPGVEVDQRGRDMAASLQRLCEEALLKMAVKAHDLTDSDHLCLAGGVSLNITATSRIREEAPFKDIFIQPAAGDSGSALGAALYLHYALNGSERIQSFHDLFLGPEFTPLQIRRAFNNRPVRVTELETDALLDRVARLIADGKIVGWFRGRMEFGPRALGKRSILADPTRSDMKDKLNAKVKHRESFRPYGVSIAAEAIGDYFNMDRPSPYMLQVATVKPEVRKIIPAAIHVNSTSRIQTVSRDSDGVYYELMQKLRDLIGVPMVLNTSFNDRGEPIVCTPDDAINCFLGTDIDYLVMENFLVEKSSKSA